MKKAGILFIINIFLTIVALSQDSTCNCLQNLNELIEQTEKNYAGFPAMLHSGKRKGYDTLNANLRKASSGEKNPKACFYVLKRYIKFFQDKHFILSYTNAADFDREIVKYATKTSEGESSTNQTSEIEGIWASPEGSLKLDIQKHSPDSYKAIVAESSDSSLPVGLLYLTLFKTKNGFIAKAFDSFITTDIPARQSGNLLQIWNYKIFGKIYPTGLTIPEKTTLQSWRNNNNGLSFQKLSAQTSVITIPSFFNNDHLIQQLITSNDSLIRTSENLIIDLRGNGGGNTGWVALLPYLMTNPIIQYDSYLRISAENVKRKLTDLEPFVNNPIPDEYKKYFPAPILSAYRKAYEELPVTKETFYPIPGVSFPIDSILPKPNKIALLVDGLCGSSTEYFLFLSKQSDKITSYGINTIGMMDYEGMSTATALPYSKFILTIPVAKSSWTDKNPIDKTGFRPDVDLSKINQTKWIEFVQQKLEAQE